MQNYEKTYKDDIRPLVLAADLLDRACGENCSVEDHWILLNRVRLRIVQRLGEEGTDFIQ